MIGASIGSIGKNGVIHEQVWDWQSQKTAFANVFGNTVFTFLYQPAVPGTIYPVRPQRNLHRIFLLSNLIATAVLVLECQLAWEAYSGLTN
jgi:amino acid permease